MYCIKIACEVKQVGTWFRNITFNLPLHFVRYLYVTTMQLQQWDLFFFYRENMGKIVTSIEKGWKPMRSIQHALGRMLRLRKRKIQILSTMWFPVGFHSVSNIALLTLIYLMGEHTHSTLSSHSSYTWPDF